MMQMDALESQPRTVAVADVSLFELGAILLRRRRLLVSALIAGTLGGMLIAIVLPRRFNSEATFLPQSTQNGAAGFALAATQLGINLPTASGFWVSGIFVELLKSRTLLQPIAQENFTVPEDGGRQGSLMDLLGVKAASGGLRLDKTVRLLQSEIVSASDDRRLGTVHLSVLTPWPSLSKALADRLVKGVNDFNLDTRKSQASAERQFVEARLVEAGKELRAAENELQTFLLSNRVLFSPTLAFERDRLQREIGLRQQVYTSLVQSREDARIREVRDTPVITVIDAPMLPQRPESRRLLLSAVLGGVSVVLLAALITLAAEAARRARQTDAEGVVEFFALWEESVTSIRRLAKRRPSPGPS
jgi:uncharacterized protein involved in exopolysaccharide biosynthesis